MILKRGDNYRRLVRQGYIKDDEALAAMAVVKTGTRSVAQLEAIVEQKLAGRLAASVPAVVPAVVPVVVVPPALPPASAALPTVADFRMSARELIAKARADLDALPARDARRELRARFAELLVADDKARPMRGVRSRQAVQAETV
jgi:hypothetical protein